MSITQLADPAMKTALGFVTNPPPPPPTDPTLAYTNNGETSTLRVGSVGNTVAITSVPTLLYNSTSAGQVAPIPIEVTIDPPPPLSPLQNVNIAKFHWLKQDVNPALNQDKYGYFNLGDGSFKIGAEWAGQGPQSVILEGELVVINAIGNQTGQAGLELQNGGDSVNPPQANARLFLDTDGQLNLVHINPVASTGKQVLFYPTNCEAMVFNNVPVSSGVGGQVDLGFTNIISSSEQNMVRHFDLNGTGVQYRGASVGTFFVTATVALDTTSGGANTGIAFFKLNGAPLGLTATRHTINQNQTDTVVIQSFITLNTGDTIDVTLASTDPNMYAAVYGAVVGPPPIPAQPAVVLVAYRIA